jgi:hypothetical protein
MQVAFFFGSVLIAFGLGAYRVEGELGPFSLLHLGLGAAAIAFGAVQGIRGNRLLREAMRFGAVSRSLAALIAVIAGAIVVERLADRSQITLDLTFEGSFEIAEATRAALTRLPGPLRMSLFYFQDDPRIRRTRLLLEEISRHGDAEVRLHRLSDSLEAEDRFGVGNSNSVVLEVGDTWELVERPTEGALFEALARLGKSSGRVVYVTRGTGEGDIEARDAAGFSGFAVALQTEGYDVRMLPSSLMSEVPADADAVILVNPIRHLRSDSIAALRAYLERGGSMVAFVEPGAQSGLEALLEEYGLISPDLLIVDPLSASVDGEVAGLSPIVFSYGKHPITRGLTRNRNTVFRRARTFKLHKPAVEDELKSLALASGHSWLLDADELPWGVRDLPTRPDGARTDYHPIAVAGRYERGDVETRIVAFGDADFASNRYLRTLFNLDLAMNAVNWAVESEEKIVLRPKTAGLVQFPVPVQDSLRAFYGVGLLVPEGVLLLGGWVWLRRRAG